MRSIERHERHDKDCAANCAAPSARNLGILKHRAQRPTRRDLALTSCPLAVYFTDAATIG
jgi:hypothetical protein